MDRHHWLVITNDIAARDLARAGWRTYPVPSATGPRPAPGDRIAVLRTHRPAYVRSATLIGTADVHADGGNELELRHRFVAPSGHEIAIGRVPHLLISHGWTDQRLAALMGTIVSLGQPDYERIESALRIVALEYGPAAARPAHRIPRTPGRRRLIAARLLNRRPSPSH